MSLKQRVLCSCFISFQTGNWYFNSICCTQRVNVLHGSLCCSASLSAWIQLCFCQRRVSAEGQKGPLVWTQDINSMRVREGAGHEKSRGATRRRSPPRVGFSANQDSYWLDRNAKGSRLNTLFPAQGIQSPRNNFRIRYNAALKGLSTWLNPVGHTHSHPH